MVIMVGDVETMSGSYEGDATKNLPDKNFLFLFIILNNQIYHLL